MLLLQLTVTYFPRWKTRPKTGGKGKGGGEEWVSNELKPDVVAGSGKLTVGGSYGPYTTKVYGATDSAV